MTGSACRADRFGAWAILWILEGVQGEMGTGLWSDRSPADDGKRLSLDVSAHGQLIGY